MKTVYFLSAAFGFILGFCGISIVNETAKAVVLLSFVTISLVYVHISARK